MRSRPEFATVGGHRIAYHRRGIGSPVVLIHGITTYSFIWDDVIPHLAHSHDVIALDLLGCGDSDKPSDVSYSLTSHAERLACFIEELGLEKVHLIGHDLGGGIVQLMAVRRPELLLGLTLVNAVGYDLWPVQPIASLRTPILRQLMMASLDFGALRIVVKRGVYHNNRVTDELMDLFMAPLRNSEGRKAFVQFARSLDNQDLMTIAEDLNHLDLPALIIRGEADPYLPDEIARRLHTGIPDSRLVSIPTASHFAQIDEPATIAEEFLAFAGTCDG